MLDDLHVSEPRQVDIFQDGPSGYAMDLLGNFNITIRARLV